MTYSLQVILAGLLGGYNLSNNIRNNLLTFKLITMTADKAITKTIHAASLGKRMLQGAAIALTLISIFFAGCRRT